MVSRRCFITVWAVSSSIFLRRTFIILNFKLNIENISFKISWCVLESSNYENRNSEKWFVLKFENWNSKIFFQNILKCSRMFDFRSMRSVIYDTRIKCIKRVKTKWRLNDALVFKESIFRHWDLHFLSVFITLTAGRPRPDGSFLTGFESPVNQVVVLITSYQ